MKLLLDTHLILWSIKNDPQLPQAVRDMILDPANTIYYSTASIWEVAIKHHVKPDKMRISGRQLTELCRKSGYVRTDITEADVHAMESLHFQQTTREHRDPFDRILIAQAKAQRLQFLTHDAILADYHEACVTVL